MADLPISGLTNGVEAQVGDIMPVARLRNGNYYNNVYLPVSTMQSQNADDVDITGGSASFDLSVSSGTGHPRLRYNNQYTPAGNVGGGTDIIAAVTLPAGALYIPGNEVIIQAYGIAANNSNPKTLTAYVASTPALSLAMAVSLANQVWRAEIRLTALGTASQRCFTDATRNGTSGAVVGDKEIVALTENASNPITVTFYATVTDGGGGINNNDLVIDNMYTEFCQ
jgi:hypothetical protein